MMMIVYLLVDVQVLLFFILVFKFLLLLLFCLCFLLSHPYLREHQTSRSVRITKQSYFLPISP